MSTLKIPDLKLFRGKRSSKSPQYQSIEQESLKLLQKAGNKELLADIKAQLYLQSYQKSLSHFVSPTKYKRKAEDYLNTHSKQTELFMKAITLPKTMYRCPNCYSKEVQPKQTCYCEMQQPRLSLARYKSNQHNLGTKQAQDYRTINRIQPITISKEQRSSSFSQRHKGHAQNHSQNHSQNRSQKHSQNHSQNRSQNHSQNHHQKNHFEKRKSLTNELQTSQNKPQLAEQYLKKNHQLQASREIQKNKEQRARQLQIQKLREELLAKQNKLDNLEFSLDDSTNLPAMHLDGIIEAKNCYIAKHKQILSSLQQIVERGQAFII